VADLKDLMDKPVSEMTQAELEAHVLNLKKLKFIPKAKTASGPKTTRKRAAPKSNKEKAVLDMLGKLSPEKMAALMAKLGGK
jgi:hypothetical protein